MNPTLLTALAVILALGAALWLLSLRMRDVSIVDLAWGPFFAIATGVVWALTPGGTPLTAALVGVHTAWAVRLGVYLARRNLGHGEDRRYGAMRAKNPRFATQSLFTVFWLQGVLAVVIALPSLLAIAHPGPALGPLALVGLLVAAAGVALEAVADAQLAAFKAGPRTEGAVLDTGVWRYSRHPNYFGNACLHAGLFVAALAGGAPAWTVISPIVMTFFLLKVSGVALLERDIGKRRPAYAEYIRRTSAFVPWPPRR